MTHPPPPPPWIEHRVSTGEEGLSVEEIVRGPLGVSGRRLQRLTRSRGIRVNGKPAHTARRVRVGDRVAVRNLDGSDTAGKGRSARSIFHPSNEATTGIALPEMVIHVRSPSFLVVEKPAGIAVHPGGRKQGPTVVELLARQEAREGHTGSIHAVHRLDRDTSGLLLLARSPAAHATLDRALRAGRVERGYMAVAAGSLEGEEGTFEGPIGPHPRRRDLRAVVPGGAPAVTRWRVLERGAGATLVEARLETGRTHQVRVHLAAAGHPLVGDRWYGGPATVAGAPPPGRLALHAHHLAFPDPEDGRRVEVVSPLPAELRGLVNS